MQTPPLFELRKLSVLIKLYPEILRNSYLNTGIYASREGALVQSWPRRLFTFQWQQERESSIFLFGPGLDSASPLHCKSQKRNKLK